MRKIITFVTASLLMASAFGAGEVYRWRGADGGWNYSDQPRPGAELVRAGTPTPPVDPNAAMPTAPPVAAPAPAAASGPVATTENSTPLPGNVAEQVRAEVAAAKKEQCTKAEGAYQSAITARRIFKTDAQGNREYMNDAEIDAARLQARANRDLACGSGA